MQVRQGENNRQNDYDNMSLGGIERELDESEESRKRD